jgi:hypothetical protein
MPILSDLDAAMMQPALSVPALRRLGGGSIRLNDAGRPLRAVGRDAVIYELRTPDGRILALRCLLDPEPGRVGALAERYTALGADPRLEGLRGAGGALPRGIRWIGDGIALPGPDLRRVTAPLIAMERVPGRTLLRAVDRLCREGQTEPLALLADAWLSTTTALEAHGFSHGDLAADNLMVRPDGTIALVDLDTAVWPLVSPPPGHASGTLAYAHPDGATRDPARRDRFPALLIWASLRILARQPELRQRWGDPPERYGGALLWSEDDLRRWRRSSLVAALDALEDAALAPLLEVVRRALRFPPDETPPLAEIADRLAPLGFPRYAGARSRAEARGVAPEPSWPATPTPGAPAPIELPWPDDTPRPPVPFTAPVPQPAPGALRPESVTMREHQRDAVRELAAAVAARDAGAAMQQWDASRHLPEAAIYAASVHLLIAHDAASTIERAIRRRDDDGLVAAVAAAERAGVAPSPDARKALRQARGRIAARAALREALANDDPHALGQLARSGQLECLGRLEPATARAVKRALAWPALERALDGDDDAAIIAAADPALWHDDGALPSGPRQRLDLARARVQWAEDLRAALRRRDDSILRGLLAGAPPGAESQLTEVESRRILRLSMREAAASRLERALREGPDREVVAALAEFASTGARFGDALDWAAVRGVVDRVTLAEAIRAAAQADPPDAARLARLLPAARAALGEDRSDAGPDWAALERSVLRAAHLARLREAIATGDDARIASAADPDPYGVRGLLLPEEAPRVARALTSLRDERRRSAGA